MKKDPAIEAIRLVRHQISAQFGHDTKALLAHYKNMEQKYAIRILKESPAPQKKSRVG